MTIIRYQVIAILAAALAFLIGCATDSPTPPAEPRQPEAARPAEPGPPPEAAPPAQPQLPLPAEPAAPSAPAVTAVSPPAAPPAVRVPRPRPTPVEPTPIPATFPVKIQSGDGREITFDRPPEKIIAFDSAIVEILFAIDEGDRIIATHDYVSYPPETESIPRVGDAFNMDLEATVALEPDLVYVFFDRFVQDMERAGLKVLYIPSLSDDFTRIADNVRMWGRIVGNPNAAERVALDFESRVERIRDVMSPIGAGPLVFQDVGGYWTPGQGTLMQEVFDLLKLENVAAEIQGYAQISPEVIVERDPALIISSDPEGIMGDQALSGVRAVRNGAIYTPTTEALSVAGPRFLDGVEELARWAYPPMFR